MSRQNALRTVTLVAIALLVSNSIGGVAVASTVRNGNGLLVTPSAYDWPMLGHDPAHSASVVEPGPYTGNELAKANLRSPVITSPAAANSSIFVIAGQSLKALNTSDLSPFWSKSLGTVSYSSPAVSGFDVYVNEENGTILAVNGATGSTDWRLKTSYTFRSSPTIQGSYLFASDYGGTLIAVSLITKSIVWKYSIPSMVVTSPAANGAVVAVGGANGVEYFIGESTGTLYWSVTTGGPISSSASFNGANAYFGSNDSKVYAVDTNAKKLTWTFATSGHVLSTPVYADGNVYVASMGGSVYALDAAIGASIWSFNTGPVSSNIALAEGTYKALLPTFVPMLYVESTSGVLRGLDRLTGASVWSLSLVGGGGGNPIVAYTKVYASSGDYLVEVGALRYVTGAATFNTSGVYTNTFSSTSTVLLAANAAWGKFGLNHTYVTVYAPGKGTNILLTNATLTFMPGSSNYNLVFYLNLASYSNLKHGTYKILVALEDGNPKFTSKNPRCCGWVDFKANFTVTS